MILPQLGVTKLIAGKDFGVKLVDGEDGALITDTPVTPGPGPWPDNPDPRPGGGKLENDPNSSDLKDKKENQKKVSSGGFDFKWLYWKDGR